MFQIGDTVMHPTAGVCKITDIRKEKFGGELRLYYVMQPVYDGANSRLFVPVDSDKVALRRLLSASQIDAILARVPAVEPQWPADERERRDLFSSLLRTGDHAAIVRMIAQLFTYKEELQKQGKKLHQSDERLLREAQALIHQEFSFALGLEEADTIRYIMEHIAA